MRVEELFEKNFAPKVTVYLDGAKQEDKGEIAGMLRGLMCAVEGWGSIKGFTNELFASDGGVILTFSSVENAHYFKSCVEYYFSDQILGDLKVKRRVYSS